jgi:hypothetical protein
MICQVFHIFWVVKDCPTRLWRAQTYARSVWSDDAGPQFQADIVEMGGLDAGSRMAMHEEDSTPRPRAVLRIPKLSSIREEKSV